MKLTRIANRLAREVSKLSFAPPVTHVYNPLVYAADSYAAYLNKWGAEAKEVILLGMNPGPWGMAQTGVPFGEVTLVREWIGIEAEVGKPSREHPRRPVEGFQCRRSEVSGARLWGWAKQRFVTPDSFFRRFFVHNYCPLCFMEESGRNRTPDKLPAREQIPLFEACDWALRASVVFWSPRLVVGVGAFAERRARHALEGLPVEIGRILHPSPASPLANRGWARTAEKQLRALGVAMS